MENKSHFITPAIMLSAAAISMIIMLIRKVDLYRMSWTLLIVMIIFYVIGDIARYLYSTIRPRVIPASLDFDKMVAEAEVKSNQEYGTKYLDEHFEEHRIENRMNEENSGAGEALDEDTHFLDDDFSDDDTSAESTEEYSDEYLDEN